MLSSSGDEEPGDTLYMGETVAELFAALEDLYGTRMRLFAVGNDQFGARW